LHEGQEVTLKTEEGKCESVGRIIRLDDDGYLMIRLTDNGQIVSAHPDGNSFDMMQGLIIPKKS
jgi:biotin--protein ligase